MAASAPAASAPAAPPRPPVLKLLVSGPYGVGKTSLLYRLCEESFVDYFQPCSLGIDFRVRTVDTRVGQLKLQIWDMQGAERFFQYGSAPSRGYYRGAVAVFLAYDITDRASFDALGPWLERAREFAPDALLVVVGCKADLGDQRVVQADEVSALVAAEGLAGYVECSAKTGAGVESMFKAVAVAAHEKASGWMFSQSQSGPAAARAMAGSTDAATSAVCAKIGPSPRSTAPATATTRAGRS
eukprot:TRINITY_DN857_c0_g1_i9.p1 TRINITY_DN857_c0_g1~~TRINITY_DN857_c0_g1_i9.p1  ORF type:complete len:251 (+),score=39.69 TRINITY_DN857_c0_g1_i9:30-755(+)